MPGEEKLFQETGGLGLSAGLREERLAGSLFCDVGQGILGKALQVADSLMAARGQAPPRHSGEKQGGHGEKARQEPFFSVDFVHWSFYHQDDFVDEIPVRRIKPYSDKINSRKQSR